MKYYVDSNILSFSYGIIYRYNFITKYYETRGILFEIFVVGPTWSLLNVLSLSGLPMKPKCSQERFMVDHNMNTGV